MYTSIAAALGANNVHLIRTSAEYRQITKDIKSNKILAHHRTHAQSETAKQNKTAFSAHGINTTLRAELRLISNVLAAEWIMMRHPIGHLIPRITCAVADSDSSIKAAGDFSVELNF